MAERRAVNKYYPPEWEPSHGSINKFVKNKRKHERLGIGAGEEQASREPRKKTPFSREAPGPARTIRFELPFDIWCGGCKRHIARNVRFNADKRAIGMYHTTVLWSFRFNCPSCPQSILMETDPENTYYIVREGAKRKAEFEPDAEDSKPDAEDYFARLERDVDATKEWDQEIAPKMKRLEEQKAALWKDDWASSRTLRSHFREAKKQAVAEEKRAKPELFIASVPERAEDIAASRKQSFPKGSTIFHIDSIESGRKDPIFKTRRILRSNTTSGGSILRQLDFRLN